MKTIIVTRHKGALKWLQKYHPEFKDCKVNDHVSPEDLKGNIVVGVLPVHLASMCVEYWHMEMDVPREYRGKELSLEDMERFGCHITRYNVTMWEGGIE